MKQQRKVKIKILTLIAVLLLNEIAKEQDCYVALLLSTNIVYLTNVACLLQMFQ